MKKVKIGLAISGVVLLIAMGSIIIVTKNNNGQSMSINNYYVTNYQNDETINELQRAYYENTSIESGDIIQEGENYYVQVTIKTPDLGSIASDMDHTEFESIDDLLQDQNLMEILQKNSIMCEEIVPIVRTEDGWQYDQEKLNDIIENIKEESISKMIQAYTASEDVIILPEVEGVENE